MFHIRDAARVGMICILVFSLTWMLSRQHGFAAPPVPATAAAEEGIPLAQQIHPLSVELPADLTHRNPPVWYSTNGSSTYLFPSFDLGSAQLYTTDNHPVDFVQRTGRLALPDATSPALRYRLDLTLHDFLQSPKYNKAILSEVRKSLHLPESQPYNVATTVWKAELILIDRTSGDRSISLGSSIIPRALHNPNPVVTFMLDGASLQDLRARGATSVDLQLQIEGGYKAEFPENLFKVTVAILDTASSDLQTRLATTPDGKPTAAFLALGGTVAQQKMFQQVVYRSIDVTISQKQGKTVDASLAQSILEKALDFQSTQIKASEIDKNKLVSILLDDQVRITTALGNVRKVSDYFKKDTTHRLATELKKLDEKSRAVNVDLEGGVNVGVVGASGKTDVDYKSYDKNQLEQKSDELTKNLEEIAKAIEGDLPMIVGLTFDTSGKVTNLNLLSFTGKIDQFRTGIASFRSDAPISLSLLTGMIDSETNVPAGTVVAYAGDRVPEGWMLCDGRWLPQGKYPELEAAIRTIHGKGIDDAGQQHPNAYNIPDYRGMFLRGANRTEDGKPGTYTDAQGTTSATDPDSGGRKAARGGTGAGNAVGSVQGDEFRSHAHHYRPALGDHPGGGTSRVSGVGASQTDRDLKLDEQVTTADGGNETRPKNASVYYIIKVGRIQDRESAGAALAP